VVDGETGFLADSQDPYAYLPLLRRLDELRTDRIRRHAERFSHARFTDRLTRWIDDATR
jgi:hypothetical protein